MWISIGSDLRIDTRRDLDDVGSHDIPVHPLNKLPYAPLTSKKVQTHACRHDWALCCLGLRLRLMSSSVPCLLFYY